MAIGETIGWKAHATETSKQSMECMPDVRALDVTLEEFQMSIGIVVMRCED